MIPLLIVFQLPTVSAEGRDGGAQGQAQESSAQAGRRRPARSPVADTTPKYLVREVLISGNHLISTRDLLKDIPALYESKSKDPGVASQTYDFTVLREVIGPRHEARRVSSRTIKGFTEYLLAKYNNRGYGGIYVYVSAKAIQAPDASATGVQRLEDDVLPIRIIEGRVESVEMRHYDAEGNAKAKGVLKIPWSRRGRR
jgi:hypothetical protein